MHGGSVRHWRHPPLPSRTVAAQPTCAAQVAAVLVESQVGTFAIPAAPNGLFCAPD